MVKTIEVSDEAYAVIMCHASANGESQVRALDELTSVADKVWVIWMPEMKAAWKKFNEYYSKLPTFEGMKK